MARAGKVGGVFLFLWPYCTACGILVPSPGIKPVPLHWKLGVLTSDCQEVQVGSVLSWEYFESSMRPLHQSKKKKNHLRENVDGGSGEKDWARETLELITDKMKRTRGEGQRWV